MPEKEPYGMSNHERRVADPKRVAEMKLTLNHAQLDTLRDLEMLGWTLWFVRNKPFAAAMPVVVDPTGNKHAMLNEDGTLNENPPFKIRP